MCEQVPKRALAPLNPRFNSLDCNTEMGGYFSLRNGFQIILDENGSCLGREQRDNLPNQQRQFVALTFLLYINAVLKDVFDLSWQIAHSGNARLLLPLTPHPAQAHIARDPYQPRSMRLLRVEVIEFEPSFQQSLLREVLRKEPIMREADAIPNEHLSLSESR
jgi:hypothetical protein